MTRLTLFLLLSVVVMVCLWSSVEADKHKLIKKIVLKKVFKKLKKAKFLPIVVPFHLSKHQNQDHGWSGGHEKWHVEEIHGGGHGGGWDQGGW